MGPFAAMVAVVNWSSRPDLYYTKAPHAGSGVRLLDWKMLNDLASLPERDRANVLGLEVLVVGYMVSAASSPAINGEVSRFLLVPDAGNLFHAPHTDPEEVIDVRIAGGGTVRLVSGKAVVVRGILSFGSMDAKPAAALHHLSAAAVQDFTR